MHVNDVLIKMNVELEKNVSYFLGRNIINETFLNELSKYSFDRLFLVTNKKLYSLYCKEFYSLLSEKYKCTVIYVEDGEQYKDIENFNKLCEDLLANGVSKSSILLAFGGGMIGNIVGLSAALLFRGIRFIEIPTSFVAQTDSTLSNKQAINASKGKNLMGTYYAPIFIWSDTELVKTENPRSIKSGFVESIKNGFISEVYFLSYLENNLCKDNYLNSDLLFDIIHKSILSKFEIIKRDPTEKKYGMILEYGHTVGHALEKLTNGGLFHGEAVAIGMVIAAQISYRMGYLSEEGKNKHSYFLNDLLNLNTNIPASIDADKLLYTVNLDNKKTKAGVRYVLLEDIGRVLNPTGDYMVDVDSGIVQDIIYNSY